jgi:large subunit ribosomal protein L9
MATEVFLMAAVPDLGAEGDVVIVADGYARNYLLPRKLAAPVTEATRRQFAKVKQERAAARAAALDDAQKRAARLEGVSCTIAVKTMEDGKLYGSVGLSDIAAALKEQGVELDRHELVLDAPFKERGVFDVPVRLHPDVQTSIKVWIVEE